MNKVDLDRAVERYLAAMAPTMRPDTVACYRCALSSLLRYLRQAHPDIRSFDALTRTPHVTGWLRAMAVHEPPYSVDTRRRYIYDVRLFFERICDWRWKEAPPPDLIKAKDFPKANRHLPRPLAPDVDLALRQTLARDGDLVAKCLLLARSTGLRIGELQRLERDCLLRSPDGHVALRVPLGKLHQERVVPIDDPTAKLVEEIRTLSPERPPFRDPKSGRKVRFLTCSESGKPSHRDRFRARLRAAVKSAGIKERVYPHRLRHTYATDLLRHGVSLPALMKLLGHTSLSMTLRYADVTPTDLSRSFLAAAEKSRERYAALGPAILPDRGLPQPIDVVPALDDVIARLQQLRFDHPDQRRRHDLQRLVERLRRARTDLATALGDRE
jgi:site-specific recombinase XerD